jgi:hypothetical protein
LRRRSEFLRTKKFEAVAGCFSSPICESIFVNIGIALAYTISYALVTYAIRPIQHVILPGVMEDVSLIFIPSGVKILSIMAFGESALIGLLAASLLCDYYFWGIGDPWVLFAISSCSIGIYFFATEVSARLGLSIYFPNDVRRIPNPRHVLLVGIFASLMNGVVSSVILSDYSPYENGGVLAVLYLLGDTSGLVAFAAIVWFALRFVRFV